MHVHDKQQLLMRLHAGYLFFGDRRLVNAVVDSQAVSHWMLPSAHLTGPLRVI
jgi:hypothetical protein